MFTTNRERLTRSNSHSSSNQEGDSSNNEISISCISRGVAKARRLLFA